MNMKMTRGAGRSVSLLALVGVATVTLALSGRSQHQESVASVTSTSPSSAIVAKAMQMVNADVASGVPRTSFVLTTAKAGNALVNGGASADALSDAPAFLFKATGDFLGRTAKLAPGGTAPRGGQLEVLIDAGTGDILMWGIDAADKPLALDSLGAVSQVAQ